jgi:WD40 repeat protein
MWFSPDDTRLVVAYFDGHIGVWDIEKRKRIGDFFRHSASVWSVQFQEDAEGGVAVIAASVDGSVRVWDLETGGETEPHKSAPHRPGMEIMAQAISPDRRTVATGYHDGSVVIWDLHSDKPGPLLQGSDWIEDLVFSEDGTCLFVVEGQKRIAVIDLSNGKRINVLPDLKSSIRKVAVSGDRVVTAGWDGSCNVWAPAGRTTELRRTLANAHDELVLQAAYSPDGRWIVTASYDKTVRVWDALTQQLVREFPEQEHELLKAEFDPSGRYVATVSSRGNVRVWDGESGQEMFSHQAESNGFLASAISDRALRAGIVDWSAVISSSPFAHNSDVMVVNGPDGMVVIDSLTGVQRVAFEYSVWEQGDAPPAGWAVIGPNDIRVAVITDGRKAQGKGRMPPELHVWALNTGKKLFSLEGHKSHPFWARFSPDGSNIVTGAMDGTAIIWDANTGKELRRLGGHGDSIVIASFSPDGEHVVTAADDEAIVWDVAAGDRLSSYAAPIRPISDIEFSPDGTRILAVVGRANAAVVWDPSHQEGRELVRLSGEQRLLYGTWSPDGQSILTTWDDGSVRLFEAIPWSESSSAPTSIGQRVQAWRKGRSVN